MTRRRRFSLLLTLSACLCFFLAGGVVVFLAMRSWRYTLPIQEIRVLTAGDGDLLQVRLLDHPPWAQRYLHSYAVNRQAKTIDLLSSYVLFEPFSNLPVSDGPTLPNFTILVPAEQLTPERYQVRHYQKEQNQWTVIGTLQSDDEGHLVWEPRSVDQ